MDLNGRFRKNYNFLRMNEVNVYYCIRQYSEFIGYTFRNFTQTGHCINYTNLIGHIIDTNYCTVKKKKKNYLLVAEYLSTKYCRLMQSILLC